MRKKYIEVQAIILGGGSTSPGGSPGVPGGTVDQVARDAASAAQTTANDALTAAGTAQSAAHTAQTDAGNAKAAADAAQMTANTAQNGLSLKLNHNLGTANDGRWLAVAATGEIITVPAPNTSELAGPYPDVPSVPTPYDTNNMYLIGAAAPYTIYLAVGGVLVATGSTSVDLSNYYTKTQIVALLAGKLDA
jgi:hypothetical protein